MVKVSSLALAGLAQASYASAAPYLFEQDAQTVLDASPAHARLDKVDPLRRESLSPSSHDAPLTIPIPPRPIRHLPLLHPHRGTHRAPQRIMQHHLGVIPHPAFLDHGQRR